MALIKAFKAIVSEENNFIISPPKYKTLVNGLYSNSNCIILWIQNIQ